MPTRTEAELIDVLERIYRAKGTPDAEARTVARHQVDANVAGHDSHGVLQTVRYVQSIDRGHIVPGAPFEIERDDGNTAVINGNWGFGYVVTQRATELAIEKAKRHGLAALTVRHQSHVGRLGGYATQIAEQGMIAMLMADSGLSQKFVVPFGAREPRLGTNPICFAAPGRDGVPVLLDMATSAVAVGKIRVAQSKGEPIPEGWILDKHGNPTTDPNDYFDGGIILPLGGDQGHKGYGLSFIVEMFCGLLTGLGYGVDPEGRHNDGIFLCAFDIGRFQDPAAFADQMAGFIDFVKDTPVAAGFDEVLVPGEVEHRTAQARRRDGIDVDESTWATLQTLLRDLQA